MKPITVCSKEHCKCNSLYSNDKEYKTNHPLCSDCKQPSNWCRCEEVILKKNWDTAMDESAEAMRGFRDSQKIRWEDMQRRYG